MPPETSDFTAVPHIVTGQEDLHPKLQKTVQRHLENPYRREPTGKMREIFEALHSWYQAECGQWPVILDTGCGRGHSTRLLAQRYPDHLVLGLDKSEQRLEHLREPLPHNARLVRTELVDFWLLAREYNWVFAKTCLYYPNPWPKLAHLKRRWHGHPIFPVVLSTCQSLELRTNWQIYAREFAHALELAGHPARSQTLALDRHSTFISAFERKYVLSEQPVYGVSAHIAPQ